jgi:hypothetical protein
LLVSGMAVLRFSAARHPEGGDDLPSIMIGMPPSAATTPRTSGKPNSLGSSTRYERAACSSGGPIAGTLRDWSTAFVHCARFIAQKAKLTAMPRPNATPSGGH